MKYTKLLKLFVYLYFLLFSVNLDLVASTFSKGGSVQKISDFFGISDGYTNNNEFPRLLCDIDGNGHNDIVGFKSTGVMVAFNDGTTLGTP